MVGGQWERHLGVQLSATGATVRSPSAVFPFALLLHEGEIGAKGRLVRKNEVGAGIAEVVDSGAGTR